MRRRVKTHAVFKSASDLSPGAKGRGISVGSAKRVTEPDPACHQESRYHGHALAELFAGVLYVKMSGVRICLESWNHPWDLTTIREISRRLWFSKLAFQADYHVLTIPHRTSRLRSWRVVWTNQKPKRKPTKAKINLRRRCIFRSWWTWLWCLILDVWKNLLGFTHWLHATLVQLTVTGVGLSNVSS